MEFVEKKPEKTLSYFFVISAVVASFLPHSCREPFIVSVSSFIQINPWLAMYPESNLEENL